MKREIKFGGCSAFLSIGDHRAMLTTREKSLPVILADAINEAGDLDVIEINRDESDVTAIRITHDLNPGELLNIVCEAISRVYDVDTFISNARTESAV